MLKFTRTRSAIATMLATARPPLKHDVELAAAVIHGAMAWVSRDLLEGKASERCVQLPQAELVAFASAYLVRSPATAAPRTVA